LRASVHSAASRRLKAARRFSLKLFIMAATLVALAAATLLLVPAGGALGAGWGALYRHGSALRPFARGGAHAMSVAAAIRHGGLFRSAPEKLLARQRP
jgi:hypothetical protein